MTRFVVIATVDVAEGRMQEIIPLLLAHRDRCLLGDRVDHKAPPVVGWETVTQPHGHVERHVVISGFECSFRTA